MNRRTFEVRSTLHSVNYVRTQVTNSFFWVLFRELNHVRSSKLFSFFLTTAKGTNKVDVLGVVLLALTFLEVNLSSKLERFTNQFVNSLWQERFTIFDDLRAYSHLIRKAVLSQTPNLGLTALVQIGELQWSRTTYNHTTTFSVELTTQPQTQRKWRTVTKELTFVHDDFWEIYSERNARLWFLWVALQTNSFLCFVIETVFEVSIRLFSDDLCFVFSSTSKGVFGIRKFLSTQVNNLGNITDQRFTFLKASSFNDILVDSVEVNYRTFFTVFLASRAVCVKSHIESPMITVSVV